MSDSGRQIGDCKHGHLPDWCLTCLREENLKLIGMVEQQSREIEAIGELVRLRAGYILGDCRGEEEMKAEAQAMLDGLINPRTT